MKRIAKYMLGAAIVVGGASCSEFLEEEINSELSPSVIQTVDDAELMLGGVLSQYASNDYYSREYFLLTEVASDHTSTVSSNSTRTAVDHYTFTPTLSPIQKCWKAGMRIIANSNYVIEGIDASDNRMTETDKKNYQATARFFRAHTYFDLVRLYGDLAILTKPILAPSELDGLKRQPVSEVYDFIISELEEIEGQFSDEWNAEKRQHAYPTKWAVKAMLSYVYLTKAGYPLKDSGAWAKAASISKDLLDNGGYGFIDGGYKELFKVENKMSNEYIWSVQIYRSIHATNCRFGGIGNQGGWGNWGVTEGFMDQFDDNDLRKKASFMTEIETVIDGKPKVVTMDEWSYKGVPMIAKFAAIENTGVPAENWNDDGRRRAQNLSGYRYGEMLLVYAEAENEANPGSALALAAINKVRERAGMPALTLGSQDEIREAIKKERTFELAFEARRRFDLIRWGDFMNVMKNDPESGQYVKEHHMLYPIPQAEYDILKDFTQNPGYPQDRSGS
ncbi:membrane protein [Fulvitalea axinellae]|uniref:Membrane protein n=1 Tax=Fulvitalea axinellae TaxID=1182444 RepID=A0AAU9C6F3_9BACT|nr:membrane protein [Fulvitalea axinellae]